MKPSLISWNAHGLNDIGKRMKVRNLLRQWKVDIICLQEMKLNFADWCYLFLEGLLEVFYSCGIGGLWRR